MNRHAASLVCVLVLLSRVQASETIGFSGMVRIADNSYLMVNDRKSPTQTGFRLGVMTVTQRDGTFFYPMEVRDWGRDEKEPSDLESCCAIPGKNSEYLVAESGKYKANFGRIFHISVNRDKEGTWQAKCLGVIKPALAPPDDAGTTFEGHQIEGMACIPGFVEGKLILVLGERGGRTKAGDKLARLVWGELDLTNHRFTKQEDDALVTKSVLNGGRDCSDLYLEGKDNTWVVWAVATRDSGDAGPFHSVVFRAGRIVLGPDKKVRFDRETEPLDVRHIHGLKVEALAAPPTCVPKSAFSIATDDESFGGVWRALISDP